MKKWFSKVIISLWLLFPSYSANSAKLSIDVDNVSIQNVLQTLSENLHENWVVSPTINRNISLHLQNMEAREILNIVLTAQNLLKLKMGNTFFITSQQNIVQQKQSALQLNNLLEDTTALKTRTWQIHFAKAEEILHFIQDTNHSFLSKNSTIHADTRTNQLCIRSTSEHLQEMTRLINSLDIPVQQVKISVRLVSIDNDYERVLGINFQNAADANFNQPSITVKLLNSFKFNMQLAALEKNGHARLISSPSLFTSNQQMASIEAGEEIPYQEVSKSGATAVNFKKAALSLQATPQILPGRKILLQLQVNQDKPSNRVVLGVPAIKTRRITTQVLIPSGKTIVLGGIFESEQDLSRQRIPFLSKIPLVGLLFQQQNVLANKRELLIFVTPEIEQL